MSWNTCKFDECESWTRRKDGDYCATHEREMIKYEEQAEKDYLKRKAQIAKQKAKNSVPRKTISKNPKDWSNTFLCSDGTKVTQAEIIGNLSQAYDHSGGIDAKVCQGCGVRAQGHAHIIPQARCKVLGKTELIWDWHNFFDACNACNLAIENPKGEQWKNLKNINYCLSFIKQHDPELYAKFEQSAVNQERETI